MPGKASTYERQLVRLAGHIEGEGQAKAARVRLVYDDHHAGDRLALIATSHAGLVELHLWRLPRETMIHVVADSLAAALALAEWAASWRRELSLLARASRSLAKRVHGLASQLAATHGQRGAGYPDAVLAQLAHLFPQPRPVVGLAATFSGRGGEPLAVIAGGLDATLWGAAVPVQIEQAGPSPRVLLFDAQAPGFLPPREVRVELTRTHDLAELGQRWRSFGLAGPPPTVVEHPLAPVDRGGRDATVDGAGDDCLSCTVDECLYCDVPDCSGVDCGGLDFGLPDCSLPDCGGLDCLPCDP